MARLKRLLIKGDMFPFLFSEGIHSYGVQKDAIPINCKLESARMIEVFVHKDVVELIFSSDEFDEIPEHGVIPELIVTVKDAHLTPFPQNWIDMKEN